ncbi:N-acetyllactosaminide 3-alpha-galactosyltransferase [Trichostrongylus colubriformis]|uniref:N-acetylgalactosaminide beta-1,3-galactosyltransferase n=1 Tax=Trichostrongylus colubriformis TaxID=6319 RepID=A0AAN8G1K0_TRICO
MKWRICDFIYPIIVLAFGFLFGRQLGRSIDHNHTRPLRKYTIEDPSSYLYKEVKIFCWIATMSQNHKTKAYFQMDTWGRQCNRILFVSNGTDEQLPILLVAQPDNYLNLYLKTKQAFLWIYKNVLQDYDWFLKADDDTYVHMPNLRHFLKSYSPKKALAFGHQFLKDGVNYHSGGSGYVLSREAVSRLGNLILKNGKCPMANAEDLYVGRCLMMGNATIIDGADENGAYRFIPIGIWHAIDNITPIWLTKTSKTRYKSNFSCCSPHFISMNYAKGDYQYFMDYLLHTLKAYGIQHH